MTLIVEVPKGRDCLSVVSFSSIVADVLPGVTVDEVNLHFDSVGSPEQLRETGWSKLPPNGSMFMVILAESPVLIVTDAGDAESA